MRAERRQELRTNELAQQLDQAGEYIKQNAPMLTAVVVIAAVIVGGVFWYLGRERSQLMAGWAALSQRNPPADAPPPVDVYKSVADDNLDPTLTVQAWLRVGESALAEMMKSRNPGAPGPPPANRNWAQTAEEAFNQVLNRSPKDAGAMGEALIGLGILAENKGDTEKARQYYRKVMDDSRFADSPLKQQASFRIEHMKDWSASVVFPAPPPPASQPATSAPTSSPTVGPQYMGPETSSPQRVSASEVPEAVRRKVLEAKRSATTQPAGP
jgi:tetratricopeptide (TPR) repeat protein